MRIGVIIVALCALSLRTGASPQAPVRDDQIPLFGRKPVVGLADTATASLPHVRIEDERLRRFFEEGTIHSPTLQTIAQRLEESDVLAFVACDRKLTGRIAGRLSFMGKSADYRMVRARVGYVGSRIRQTALLGHELRHALEVADTPEIVDLLSFDREYRRMGHVSHHATTRDAIAYETEAAMDAYDQIMKELESGT